MEGSEGKTKRIGMRTMTIKRKSTGMPTTHDQDLGEGK